MRRIAALSLVLGLAIAPAHAEGLVTIKVGYSPGGSYDATARLVAEFLGRHLPGNPDVVVENDPGAGSLKLAKSFMATGKPASRIFRAAKSMS